MFPLNVSFKIIAKSSKCPILCKLATANNIPIKKKIVAMSTFLITAITESFDLTSALFLECKISVTTHKTPRLNKIPK